jgi:hypothetical protein
MVTGIGNPKNPAWYSGGLAGLLPVGCGHVYYCNGGSDGPVNDAFDGLTVATPKRLLQSALALCTTGNDDVVVVLNYGGNARAAEVFPITLTKDRVHIIGVGTISNKWPVVSVLAPAGADANDPAIFVTGQDCEITGLELGGGDTAGCIEVGSTPAGVWGLWVHECWFGVTGAGVGQDGINVPANLDAPYLTVTGCRFGTYITRDGIRVEANGNATRCMIGLDGYPANTFNQVPGIAINMAGSLAFPSICNNRIAISANTAGAGITLSANVLDAWVDGNRANFGDTTMGNVPFSDLAGAGANNWGLNYQGITAAMPT